MPRKALSRPTDGEIDILQVLWKLPPGGGTVREICQRLERAKGEPTSPEAMLTRLEIMVRKGLAKRDEDRFPKVFSAAVKEDIMQRDLVRDFLKRVFGGSAKRMVMHALDEKGAATPQELEELSKRLKELRSKGGGGGSASGRGKKSS